MPFRDLVPDGDFDSKTLEVMNGAYNCTIGTLGIKDRSDPATKLIARKILDIVASGVTGRHEVYEQAVAAFRK